MFRSIFLSLMCLVVTSFFQGCGDGVGSTKSSNSIDQISIGEPVEETGGNELIDPTFFDGDWIGTGTITNNNIEQDCNSIQLSLASVPPNFSISSYSVDCLTAQLNGTNVLAATIEGNEIKLADGTVIGLIDGNSFRLLFNSTLGGLATRYEFIGVLEGADTLNFEMSVTNIDANINSKVVAVITN